MYDSIVLKGKYSKYIKELTTDTPSHPKFFSKYYDAYLFGALYGVIHNVKRAYNPSTDAIEGEEATIRSDVLMKSTGKYRYGDIRKIVIMSDRSDNSTFKERLDRALRYDYSPDDTDIPELKEKSYYNRNTELFDQYALGGIEEIYLKLIEKQNPEDILDFMKRYIDDYIEDTGVSKPSE